MEFNGRLGGGGDWTTQSRHVTKHVHAASALMPNRTFNVPIRLLNASNKTVSPEAGAEVTTAEPVTVSLDEGASSARPSTAENDAKIAEIVDQVDDTVPEDIRCRFRALLSEHIDAFSISDAETGHATAITHEIHTGDAQPVRQLSRRPAPAHQEAID